MSTLFDDLKQGLQEAIAYEKGQGTARIKTYTIAPVKEYSSAEIRDIRMKAGMTQSVLLHIWAYPRKTVEAWEGGRTHPSGPAFRLLEVLASDKSGENQLCSGKIIFSRPTSLEC